MSDQQLGGEQILDLLREVAAELSPEGPQHKVLVVGGSLLALHGLRDSTRDVDSAQVLDDALKTVVATVAARHDLPTGWLNDNSAAWRPQTLDEKRCEVLLDEPTLRVLAAPLTDVFLMKLNALRDRDEDDLVVLWPLTGFATPAEAVEAFYRAYPFEEHDQNLVDEVERFAHAAGSR